MRFNIVSQYVSTLSASYEKTVWEMCDCEDRTLQGSVRDKRLVRHSTINQSIMTPISQSSREELVQLLTSYNDVFSKSALDCGEAKGFEHRIRLTFCVPLAHYQKLRQVLKEMEEQEIIRKSVSEYASLVMVWKKDGGLHICTDFRWLNARTLKDAHPLPHQSDCFAALGGNT